MRNTTFGSVLGYVFLIGSNAGAAGIVPGGVDDPRSFDTTWHKVNYNWRFNQLPLTGSVENKHIPWADSYWPMQRAGMAYRWREFQGENVEVPLHALWLNQRDFVVLISLAVRIRVVHAYISIKYIMYLYYVYIMYICSRSLAL